MDKILLIISREYLSRVQKKSFLIMSLVGPLIMVGFMFFVKWSATSSIETKTIYVVDETERFAPLFENSDETVFIFRSDLAESKQEVTYGKTDGVLYIPASALEHPTGVTFFSQNNPSFKIINTLRWRINSQMELIKLQASGLDQKFIDNLKSDVQIKTVSLSDGDNEKSSNSTVSMTIGYMCSFTIYMFIFIYGSMCMKGVLEEKTSRVIEILITTVSPFKIMMGKVIGIAGVGLTQFLLWIVIAMTILFAAGVVIDPPTFQPNTEVAENIQALASANESGAFAEISDAMSAVNIPLVVVSFLFFFLTGYLLYGALFAAIGAAVDSETEMQQFMLPMTIPLLISIISLTAIIQDPHGSFAFWMSIIPFHRTRFHDDARTIWCGHLGASTVHGAYDCRFFIYHLDRKPRLSSGNFDVRHQGEL